MDYTRISHSDLDNIDYSVCDEQGAVLTTAHISPPVEFAVYTEEQVERYQRRRAVVLDGDKGHPAHAVAYRGGSFLQVKRERSKVYPAGGGVRGKAGFSNASRRRLMRLLATLSRQVLPTFLTLTYPGEYPEDPRRWKRDLDTFFKALRRKFVKVSAVWKLEFQKRGAPHFHMFVFGVASGDLADWVYPVWYRIVGSGDERHLRHGADVQAVRSIRGVYSYASKYLTKEERSMVGVGRFWGVVGRENLPVAERVILPLLCSEDGVTLLRYMRRFARVKGRISRQSLTIICDVSQWLSKLDELRYCRGFQI